MPLTASPYRLPLTYSSSPERFCVRPYASPPPFPNTASLGRTVAYLYRHHLTSAGVPYMIFDVTSIDDRNVHTYRMTLRVQKIIVHRTEKEE